MGIPSMSKGARGDSFDGPSAQAQSNAQEASARWSGIPEGALTVSSLEAGDELGRLLLTFPAEQVVGKAPEQATDYGGDPE